MIEDNFVAPQDIWHSLDRAQRDAAYDNNAAATDVAAWREARDKAALAFRAAHPRHLDVPYGDKPRTVLDLFPAADPQAPCLMFIHGGYWQRNRHQDFAGYVESLVQAGWSAVLPSHTLAPDASLTTIVSEIGQALDWLSAHGTERGVTGPLVIAGWSAGAHLAAMHLGHRRVAAGLAISGVYDLGPLRETGLDDALKLQEDEVAALSPLRLPVIRKPLAIAYGENELAALVHDSRRLHARRVAAGASGPLLPVAGADHFSVLDALRRPGGELVRAAEALLGSQSVPSRATRVASRRSP